MGTKLQAPNVPYVEARHHKGQKQKPTLIVLYSSGTTTEAGAALGLANAMHQSNAPMLSVHYTVDESVAIQCVWDKVEANHCAYSVGSIAVKMCDDPSKSRARWQEKPHQSLLYRTANLVAELCFKHKIKPRFLTDEELARWGKHHSLRRGGIVTYAQMARVFQSGNHWDPNEWPRYEFLSMLHSRLSILQNKK